MRLIHGDCLQEMATLPAESVDAIVTDPPYGLSFMGKDWDHGVPGEAFWREALRVAKPGAHLLAFGGSRTYHRLACAIEDAGWEVRDCIMWVYGSGFPKSHNLTGDWQGWGTALKPAYEPIIVARKPLVGTVAANVQQYGTGAINVDGCRVQGGGASGLKPYTRNTSPPVYQLGRAKVGRQVTFEDHPAGRWPANFIHDGSDEVVGLFPMTTSGGGNGVRSELPNTCMSGKNYARVTTDGQPPSSGSAARFFYTAKASKRDRDEGLDLRASARRQGARPGSPDETGKFPDHDHRERTGNFHPTVKPTDLMRYLCRLVTPPRGIVLDPFMGSGSTGKGATLEGFDFIGIEQNAEYIEIAKARIQHALDSASQKFFL